MEVNHENFTKLWFEPLNKREKRIEIRYNNKDKK